MRSVRQRKDVTEDFEYRAELRQERKQSRQLRDARKRKHTGFGES